VTGSKQSILTSKVLLSNINKVRRAMCFACGEGTPCKVSQGIKGTCHAKHALETEECI